MRFNLFSKIHFLISSFFKGLKNADNVIIESAAAKDGIEVNQSFFKGGTLNDFLYGKETEQLKELRDSYYRILKESDKYEVEVKWSDNGDLSAIARKKDASFFKKHPPLYCKNDEKIILIQDNEQISKYSLLDASSFLSEYNGIYDFETTLQIVRNGYVSRFAIEKFVRKIVLKDFGMADRYRVDLYVPMYASQFGKIDALLIAELNKLIEGKVSRLDFLSFDALYFITDKAWNAENLLLYYFDDIHYNSINIFDGNFVITFDCHISKKGEDITEKYKTNTMDKKYEKKTPKKDSTDISVIYRKLKE